MRPATEDDLEVLGTLAGGLVRFHHAVDPLRFAMTDNVEKGYRWWFRKELSNPDAMLRVAVDEGGRIVGYTYARAEPHDWNMLLAAHVALHDIFVDPSARGHRVGEALMEAFATELAARGSPRVVLHTMVSNAAAQKLFAKYGFRPTMVEMTRG